MKNIKIQIITVAFLLLFISVEESRAEKHGLPAYNSMVKSETIEFLNEMACNAQFTNSIDSEMNMIMDMDATLEIENWMTKTDWSEGQEFINDFDLQLESWMTEYNWSKKNEVINEPDMNLEAWMTTPVEWNHQQLVY